MVVVYMIHLDTAILALLVYMFLRTQRDFNFYSNLQPENRLQKELMQLMMCDEKKQLSAFPASDNIMQWVATIAGPEGTPYEGLSYKLSIHFPTDYPYSAPRVTFTSKCFHPNVSDNGEICLDILKENWSALYDVRTILLSIQSLLNEPNNNSPLNITAANMWQDQTKFTDAVISFYNSEK